MLDDFDELVDKMKGKQVVVILDYDGTLTPLASRPDLAFLPEGMHETLEALKEKYDVAILSDRDTTDIEELVGVTGIAYAGSCGFDIVGAGEERFEYQEVQKFLPSLDAIEKELKQRLQKVEGVLVERKKYGIAVHHRLVAEEDLPQVKRW